ncbi:GNAT family N-acetyltransferase [Aurantiacibacter suaedae]|uniref:GNAT family N-acetyltransferase n=1 Tax=Aurantiacibacter suaedae TaxID=2545755 RepID=UPI001F4F5633|nr:GNAT family N-acetyltransferase [Aurantiacibacter suaedae]
MNALPATHTGVFPAGEGARLWAGDWRKRDNAADIRAWDALAKTASEPNPFFESWYLLPSLRALDPHGSVRLAVLEASGRWLGVIPLRWEPYYYSKPLPHWRVWCHENTFLGQPLIARGFEQAFWHALLRWLDRHALFALFAHLPQMGTNGPVHHALAAELTAHPRPAGTVLETERALLATELSAEDYLEASLSTKKRKELRRQHRRLGEEGALSVDRCEGAENIASWTEEFLTLEASGWKGRAASALASARPTAALFREALAEAAALARLERLAIRVDGKPIAMLATFTAPPGAFSYKTAFAEDYARFSPGVLLQREALALVEREGIGWIDSCAGADHPMIDHFWRERRRIAHHSIAIGGSARRALFACLNHLETGRAPRGIA